MDTISDSADTAPLGRGRRFDRLKKVALFFGRLQIKLTMAYSLIIVGVIVLLNTYPLFSTQSLMVSSKRQDMLQSANLISYQLSQLDEMDGKLVKSVVDTLGSFSYRVYVLDRDSYIIYDSSDMFSEVGSRLDGADFPGLSRALEGKDYSLTVYENREFISHTLVPVAVALSPGEVLGAVYIYDRDYEQGGLLASMQSRFQSLSVMIILFVILLSVVMASQIGKRFSAMTRAIKAVRQGNYSHRIQLSGNDELSIIAGEFNELSSRLQKTDELRRQFVSDASHELKTPLTAMRLMTDTILNTDNLPGDRVRDFVGDIASETERLSRISENLLTLTHLDYSIETKRERIDITSITGKVVRILTPLASARGITIRCEISGNVFVLGDYDHIYQILVNLIENAIKYNVDNGRVNIYLYGSPDTGRATVIVDDTGIGIPEKDIPRIFDRFYRVDKARSRETGGTGLGLSIVMQSVTACGGTIRAERSPSGGARFVVELDMG